MSWEDRVQKARDQQRRAKRKKKDTEQEIERGVVTEQGLEAVKTRLETRAQYGAVVTVDEAVEMLRKEAATDKEDGDGEE